MRLFNAHSICNKLSELHYLLSSDKPDVVCITETWLHSGINNSILTGDIAYSVFRSDRSVSHHGGVCVLTNNNTVRAVSVVLPPRFSHVELCALDIICNSTTTRLFNCYRPPSSNRDPDGVKCISDMCNCIDDLYSNNSTVIICGDFNLPDINWSVDNCIKQADFCCSGIFLNMFYKHGLHQFVSEPTRFDNLLDLVSVSYTHLTLPT